MGIDMVALENRDPSRQRQKPHNWYGLRHKPTQLWFRVNRGLYDRAEYNTHADAPTVKSKAIMTRYLNLFDHPQDWELVPFRLTPIDQPW